jgi:WD40 repeat protein
MSSDRRSVVAGGKDTLMQLWDVETSQVFSSCKSFTSSAMIFMCIAQVTWVGKNAANDKLNMCAVVSLGVV